jgi:hypothetical protein
MMTTRKKQRRSKSEIIRNVLYLIPGIAILLLLAFFAGVITNQKASELTGTTTAVTGSVVSVIAANMSSTSVIGVLFVVFLAGAGVASYVVLQMKK